MKLKAIKSLILLAIFANILSSQTSLLKFVGNKVYLQNKFWTLSLREGLGTGFQLGYTATGDSGSMRYNNGVMQYYDGGAWKSIASIGSGAMIDTTKLTYLNKSNTFDNSTTQSMGAVKVDTITAKSMGNRIYVKDTLSLPIVDTLQFQGMFKVIPFALTTHTNQPQLFFTPIQSGKRMNLFLSPSTGGFGSEIVFFTSNVIADDINWGAWDVLGDSTKFVINPLGNGSHTVDNNVFFGGDTAGTSNIFFGTGSIGNSQFIDASKNLNVNNITMGTGDIVSVKKITATGQFTTNYSASSAIPAISATGTGDLNAVFGNISSLLGIGANRATVQIGSTNGHSSLNIMQSTTAGMNLFWIYNATEASAYGRIGSLKGMAFGVNNTFTTPSSATDMTFNGTTLTFTGLATFNTNSGTVSTTTADTVSVYVAGLTAATGRAVVSYVSSTFFTADTIPMAWVPANDTLRIRMKKNKSANYWIGNK